MKQLIAVCTDAAGQTAALKAVIKTSHGLPVIAALPTASADVNCLDCD